MPNWLRSVVNTILGKVPGKTPACLRNQNRNERGFQLPQRVGAAGSARLARTKR
jgi:hypothetical protein